MESSNQPPSATTPPAANAGQQVQVRIDDSKLQSTYANAFLTRETPDEVIFDFGLELVGPGGADKKPQMLIQISQRLIVNYPTAKKLALTLGQVLHRHEDQFGAIELDLAKRSKAKR